MPFLCVQCTKQCQRFGHGRGGLRDLLAEAVSALSCIVSAGGHVGEEQTRHDAVDRHHRKAGLAGPYVRSGRVRDEMAGTRRYAIRASRRWSALSCLTVARSIVS